MHIAITVPVYILPMTWPATKLRRLRHLSSAIPLVEPPPTELTPISSSLKPNHTKESRSISYQDGRRADCMARAGKVSLKHLDALEHVFKHGRPGSSTGTRNGLFQAVRLTYVSSYSSQHGARHGQESRRERQALKASHHSESYTRSLGQVSRGSGTGQSHSGRFGPRSCFQIRRYLLLSRWAWLGFMMVSRIN